MHANGGIARQRPFRSPHHTSSDVALVGGGSMPRPGEVTLAHNGIFVFWMNCRSLAENVLESLRQPLEDHEVNHLPARNQTVRFSLAVYVDFHHEPLPLRVVFRSSERMSLSSQSDSAIYVQNFRTTA